MRKLTDVQCLVVHCTASPPDANLTVQDLRRIHMQLGMRDIAFHYVIRRNGDVCEGRPIDMPGAHSGTHDLTSLGIALVGGLKKGTTKAESNFTPAQYLSLQKLLARLGSEFPDAEVLGCRDLPGVNNTASPSFDVREWLRRIDEESTLPAQD